MNYRLGKGELLRVLLHAMVAEAGRDLALESTFYRALHAADQHRHSRIGFVPPAERHRGEDQRVLARRQALYQEARNRIPTRWSGNTCNWTLAGAVTLNPERVQEPQSLKGAA